MSVNINMDCRRYGVRPRVKMFWNDSEVREKLRLIKNMFHFCVHMKKRADLSTTVLRNSVWPT
jgi:hypothetical protein